MTRQGVYFFILICLGFHQCILAQSKSMPDAPQYYSAVTDRASEVGAYPLQIEQSASVAVAKGNVYVRYQEQIMISPQLWEQRSSGMPNTIS